MKKILITLLILSITTLNAQISKAEIIATGLTCSMCSNAINKQFKTLSDIEKVETDLNTNTFTVYLRRDSKITPKILKDCVEKAGFFVGSMIVYNNFKSQKIEDNLELKQNNLNWIFIDSKSQILNGETKLKILDKGYLTQKEFKKASRQYAKYPTYTIVNKANYHAKVL